MRIVLKYPKKIYVDRITFMLNYENNRCRLETFKNYMNLNNYNFSYQIIKDHRDIKYYLFVIKGKDKKIYVSDIKSNKLLSEYMMKNFIDNYKKYVIV